MSVTSTSFNPDPPVKGTDLRLTIAGKLRTVPGAGAKVNVTIKYGIITLLSQQHDWADLLTAVPTAPGPVELCVVIPMTADAPSGAYTVHIEATTQAGECITSLNGDFMLGN